MIANTRQDILYRNSLKYEWSVKKLINSINDWYLEAVASIKMPSKSVNITVDHNQTYSTDTQFKKIKNIALVNYKYY